MQRLFKIKISFAAASLMFFSTASIAVFIPAPPAATPPVVDTSQVQTANTPLPAAAQAALVPNPPALKDDQKFWADRVKTRAQQRWQLVLEKKYAESFAYLTTASKGFTTLEQYSAQIASANYAEVTVHEVVCEVEACRAEIRTIVDLRVPRIPTPIRTPLFLSERWIVEDGDARLLRR